MKTKNYSISVLLPSTNNVAVETYAVQNTYVSGYCEIIGECVVIKNTDEQIIWVSPSRFTIAR